MAVEDRLATLIAHTRERAEAMVSDTRAAAADRDATARERLAAGESALLEEIAAERARRLAAVAEEAEHERVRWTAIDEETVGSLADWVVERILDTAPSGDGGGSAPAGAGP